MKSEASVSSISLGYSSAAGRRRWRAYLLGLFTLPLAYLLLYSLLRVTGVYRVYFSQGSWEIEGSARLHLIDVAYLPMISLEGDMKNWLRWLPEPSGG